MTKDKKDIRIWLLVGGMFLMFAIINWTIPLFYGLGCCTWNQHECIDKLDKSDINCTQEIIDKCCEDCVEIRYCDGQVVNNPYECYDYYCTEVGVICKPISNVALDTFTCTCTNLDDILQ